MTRILILAGAVLLMPAHAAQSSETSGSAIVLSSTLISIERHTRTAMVQVSNHSSETQRYRTSFIDMMMGSDGSLSMGPDAARDLTEHSATPWLLATPRSFGLAPGETQAIRLLVRRPAELAEGDYRAHLRIAQEPPPTSGGGLSAEAPEADMRFHITTVYSVSVPVMVRHGRPTLSVHLAEARLADPHRLALTVAREGTASFRGYAHAASGSLSANLPITIYRELSEVELTFDLEALAGSRGPVLLTLHEGDPPRGDRPISSPPLSTLSVPRQVYSATTP